MSIRNVARRVRSSFVSCEYSSSDDSSQTTEIQIDPPKIYCLATCKKADTHKEKSDLGESVNGFWH